MLEQPFVSFCVYIVWQDRASCGRHLTKVRHQGRPVSRTESTRVDGSATGVGSEGEVRGDPGDGGDETRHTSNVSSWKNEVAEQGSIQHTPIHNHGMYM